MIWWPFVLVIACLACALGLVLGTALAARRVVEIERRLARREHVGRYAPGGSA